MVKKKNRKQNLKGHTYTRTCVERKIAERLGFTYKDVGLIFDEFEDILREIVTEKETLGMTRMFSMYLTKTKPRKGYNVAERRHEEYPETYYVSFKGSKSLLSGLPEMQNRNLDKD